MKRADTKEVIIESAIKLFFLKGYTETSLSDIAQEVKITAAAIYYHIKNKEELLWLVYQSLQADLETLVVKPVEECGTAEAKLVTFIRCITELWIKRPEVALLQPNPLKSLPEHRKTEYHRHKANWMQMIRDIVEELTADDKKFNATDADFATYTLANIFSLQTGILLVDGKFSFPIDRSETEALARAVTKFYCQAILGRDTVGA